MAAMFYKLNTLIRLVTDQLLGYRLCHLSKSWKSRFVVAVNLRLPIPLGISLQCSSSLDVARLNLASGIQEKAVNVDLAT